MQELPYRLVTKHKGGPSEVITALAEFKSERDLLSFLKDELKYCDNQTVLEIIIQRAEED